MDNLARNAMLARQAGMSYGQWKASHPTTKAERGLGERECVCQHCGRVFLLKNKHKRKYCEFYCESEAAKLRQKERKEKTISNSQSGNAHKNEGGKTNEW